MKIDSSIKILVNKGVYNPAEDSYLLIKAVETREGEKTLDMGCGSGITALHLAKHGCIVTACDIKNEAVENTKVNAKRNRLNMKVFKSDLFSDVEGKFDVITFNPPYLPIEGEDSAWDGGKGGIEVINRFLEEAVNHLNSNGRIYLVMSSFTDRGKMLRDFEEVYEFSIVAEQSFFFEKLFCIQNNAEEGFVAFHRVRKTMVFSCFITLFDE